MFESQPLNDSPSASSLMASSSSHTWKYDVFASLHGLDVPKTSVRHIRKQLNYNGITMFDDQGIERGQTTSPALTEAIRESRISIVVLSKNYASSSLCLDELLEILKCKENIGQIVMPVYYGVDPSDVQKQTGDFGIAFNKTCARKTEEERRRWSQALNDVAHIPGEQSLKDDEQKMIEQISRDISNKLNNTISRDFGDMVGLQTHLEEIQSLLHLDNVDEVMIVGICDPAGIGKTTIARASYDRFSCSFQLACFVESLRGRSYNSGLDEYGLKLRHQKVLIIRDDVNDLRQLEALANETKWFGPGSRIIVTTRDQELLRQHGINNTYHVNFPYGEEAFRQSHPRNGFKQLAVSAVEPSSSNKRIEKVKHRCSTGMAFLVVITLLVEIASAVSDQLSSIRKPYFARISLVMSILSVVFSILDLTYKIRAHKARFRCKWPIPWFYYPARGYRRIFGSFTDTVLLCCVVGGLIVSTINYSFIEKQVDGPIKVSIWPLFFAIGIVGSKFMEKPAISKDYSL